MDVLVRPMREGEQEAVRKLARRSFPLLQRGFFSLSPDVLVAERAEELVGAAVLRIVGLPRKRTGGLIAWLMVIPGARNLGIGQRLVDEALRRFDERRCNEVMCAIEGFNTGSSRRVLVRGFTVLSPGRQVLRYGPGMLGVWLRSFHYLDIGHLLWTRPGDSIADNPLAQWWGVALLNSLFALLALWRSHGFGRINPMLWLTMPVACIAVFGARSLAMKLTAQAGRPGRGRVRVRFRAWESGFPLSLLVALAIGRLFPVPGSFYPDDEDWRYRSLLHRLEPMAFGGSLAVLALVLVVTSIPRFTVVPASARLWLDSVVFVGKPLALFDVALPIFPFSGFNGRRIWDWNKVVWAVTAAGAVVVFLFA